MRGRNTPGDWQRIQSRAGGFVSNPSRALWQGPQMLDGSGCVKHVSGSGRNNNPPRVEVSGLRDAAFVYRLTGQTRYREAAKSVLLQQSRVGDVDFSNTRRWCVGAMADGSPTFDTANWLTKLLYAYDYLGQESFSQAERDQLNTWFHNAAAFWLRYSDSDLDRLFVKPQGRQLQADERRSQPVRGARSRTTAVL